MLSFLRGKVKVLNELFKKGKKIALVAASPLGLTREKQNICGSHKLKFAKVSKLYLFAA